MRYHQGDEVTVQPIPSDPYILEFQRYATVSRSVDAGYYVRLGDAMPPGREFGPIPAGRLLRGWKDEDGRWRSW